MNKDIAVIYVTVILFLFFLAYLFAVSLRPLSTPDIKDGTPAKKQFIIVK